MPTRLNKLRTQDLHVLLTLATVRRANIMPFYCMRPYNFMFGLLAEVSPAFFYNYFCTQGGLMEQYSGQNLCRFIALSGLTPAGYNALFLMGMISYPRPLHRSSSAFTWLHMGFYLLARAESTLVIACRTIWKVG